MMASSVFRRKSINENSSQPAKDSKRLIIKLKISQVH